MATTSLPTRRREGEREVTGQERRFYAGVLLAATRLEEFEVTNSGAVRVPSRSRPGFKHTVEVSSSRKHCPCEDCALGGNVCAHIESVLFLRRCHEALPEGAFMRRSRFLQLLDLSVDAFRPVRSWDLPHKAQEDYYQVRSLSWTPDWLREAARLRWRAVGEAWSRGREVAS